MPIRRRDLLKIAGAAALSGSLPQFARGVDNASIYDLPRFGDARILHLTDTHAQLTPVFFREPSVSLSLALSATALIMAAGALAGFFPAYRAARVNPVVALRSE